MTLQISGVSFAHFNQHCSIRIVCMYKRVCMYRGHGGHCFHRLLFLHRSEQVGWGRYKYNIVVVSSVPSGSKRNALGASVCAVLYRLWHFIAQRLCVQRTFFHILTLTGSDMLVKTITAVAWDQCYTSQESKFTLKGSVCHRRMVCSKYSSVWEVF